MIAHHQILENLGRAVAGSAAVLAYCQAHFGRGLLVHVGAYADKIPGEAESPFLWIFAEGQNSTIAKDESFVATFIVGACPLSFRGERVIENEIAARTDDANGLVVSGGGALVEDLRDLILETVRAARPGARVASFTRSENNLSHQPLEWAVFEVELVLDISLDEIGG